MTNVDSAAGPIFPQKVPLGSKVGGYAQPRGTAILMGFEPTTSTVTGWRALRCSTEPYAPRLGVEPSETSFGGLSVPSTQGM